MKTILTSTFVMLFSLSAFSQQKDECGLKGSVTERLKDCADMEDAKVGSFSLILRRLKRGGLNPQIRWVSEKYSVYRQDQSGKLWAVGLDTKWNDVWFDFDGAKKMCDTMMDGVNNTAVLGNIRWRLPTRAEIQMMLDQVGKPGRYVFASEGLWSSDGSNDKRFPDQYWAFAPEVRSDFNGLFRLLPKFNAKLSSACVTLNGEKL